MGVTVRTVQFKPIRYITYINLHFGTHAHASSPFLVSPTVLLPKTLIDTVNYYVRNRLKTDYCVTMQQVSWEHFGT